MVPSFHRAHCSHLLTCTGAPLPASSGCSSAVGRLALWSVNWRGASACCNYGEQEKLNIPSSCTPFFNFHVLLIYFLLWVIIFLSFFSLTDISFFTVSYPSSYTCQFHLTTPHLLQILQNTWFFYMESLEEQCPNILDPGCSSQKCGSGPVGFSRTAQMGAAGCTLAAVIMQLLVDCVRVIVCWTNVKYNSSDDGL